jgi:hypothetical protein
MTRHFPPHARRVVAAATTATLLVALVAAAPAGALTPQVAPLPATAAAVPEAILNAVHCTSYRNCVAVGRYESKSNLGRALIVTEVGGVWGHAETITMPTDALDKAFGVLNAIDCTSVGNCVAVGQYQTSQSLTGPTYPVVDQPLIVVERSGNWQTAVKSQLPPGAIDGEVTALNGVSCPSVGHCLAVGQYITAKGNEAFTVQQSGNTWSGARTVTLRNYARSNFITQLDGVSCVANGYCVAVGQFANGAPSRQPLVVQEAKGVWSVGHAVPVPSVVRNPWAGLFSIDCLSWGNCVSVGVVSSPPKRGQGLIEVEVKGQWERGILAPLPSGVVSDSIGDQLAAVSCKSNGNCDAVGQFTDGDVDEGVLINATAGKWGSGVIAPSPANAVAPAYAILSGVACTASNQCVMVGQYQAQDGDPALIENP